MIIPASNDDSSSVEAESSTAGPSSLRIKRGTKVSDMPGSSTDVPPLSTFNGPFQLSEYLAVKVRNDPHDVKGLVDTPKSVPAMVWIYEHLRRLPIDLTSLLNALLPVCSRKTCPEMKANEWMYLCVAHSDDMTCECCAIDYILHTLDSTTTLLNSSEQFPSRLSIPNSSSAHFPSLFRRLSRIFLHAYYHHREAFALSENETSLYSRFAGLCERYNLVSSALLAIPKAALTNSEDGEDDTRGYGTHGSLQDEEEDSSEEEKDESSSDGEDQVAKEGGTSAGKRARSLDLDRDSGAAADPKPGVKDGDSQAHQSSRDSKVEEEPKINGYPQRTETMLSLSEKVDSLSINEDKNESNGTAKDDNGDPNSPPVPRSSVPHATLGRKKQSRGTMLWSSDSSPAPSLPSTSTAVPETAVTIAEPTAAESSLDGEAIDDDKKGDPDGPVAKDEIELLEEEGKLSPAAPVAPLAPTPSEAAVDSTDKAIVNGDPSDTKQGKGDLKKEDAITSTSPSSESDGKNSAPLKPVSRHAPVSPGKAADVSAQDPKLDDRSNNTSPKPRAFKQTTSSPSKRK